MTETLEYNSNRTKLIIPEYGRHIQKMVKAAVNEKDDKKRKEMAETIVEVMGNISPFSKNNPDDEHKLWDQLFMISDYKLEVDSPYPMPTAEEMQKHPEPLAYPENNPRYRFYGNNIKLMIDEAKKWEEGPKKEALILSIANHMKKSYLNWNKDTVEDYIIFDHLYELSDGKINLNKKDEDLSAASDLIDNNNNNTNKKRNYKSKRRKYKGRSRKRH